MRIGVCLEGKGGDFGGVGLEDGKDISLLNMSNFFTLFEYSAASTARTSLNNQYHITLLLYFLTSPPILISFTFTIHLSANTPYPTIYRRTPRKCRKPLKSFSRSFPHARTHARKNPLFPLHRLLQYPTFSTGFLSPQQPLCIRPASPSLNFFLFVSRSRSCVLYKPSHSCMLRWFFLGGGAGSALVVWGVHQFN